MGKTVLQASYLEMHLFGSHNALPALLVHGFPIKRSTNTIYYKAIGTQGPWSHCSPPFLAFGAEEGHKHTECRRHPESSLQLYVHTTECPTWC